MKIGDKTGKTKPCEKCGCVLYEKNYGGGGFVWFDTRERMHDDTQCERNRHASTRSALTRLMLLVVKYHDAIGRDQRFIEPWSEIEKILFEQDFTPPEATYGDLLTKAYETYLREQPDGDAKTFLDWVKDEVESGDLQKALESSGQQYIVGVDVSDGKDCTYVMKFVGGKLIHVEKKE